MFAGGKRSLYSVSGYGGWEKRRRRDELVSEETRLLSSSGDHDAALNPKKQSLRDADPFPFASLGHRRREDGEAYDSSAGAAISGLDGARHVEKWIDLTGEHLDGSALLIKEELAVVSSLLNKDAEQRWRSAKKPHFGSWRGFRKIVRKQLTGRNGGQEMQHLRQKRIEGAIDARGLRRGSSRSWMLGCAKEDKQAVVANGMSIRSKVNKCLKKASNITLQVCDLIHLE